MLKPGIYSTTADVEAIVDEITTVRHLRKNGMDSLASMVEYSIISLLAQKSPDMDFMEMHTKAQGHIIALGRINHIWKEPIWDWETGKLLSANSGGNWALHDNFNIPADAEPI